ncbi:Putative dehydrogenase, partial [hydrothermal vent metagenome]
MNNQKQTATPTRREFIQKSGVVAGATALMGATLPQLQAGLNAGEKNTIQIALVGCGGRGAGAVVNALTIKNGPIKLVAMADVFQNRLDTSYRALNGRYPNKMDVPKERQFIGFDGYKKAIDCLNPGDVVIMTTPLAFRWVHFTYAIEKGVNVFMEKPLTADGPTSRKMLALSKLATKKNLKVGVGLMC